MALDPSAGTYLLACGRDVDQVQRDLARGRWDAHEQRCPHCQAAAASLQALADVAAAMRADRTEPSPGVLDTIMAAVRADVRRADLLPLRPPADPPGPSPDLASTGPQPPMLAGPMLAGPVLAGQAQVARSAVAAVLRYAADSLEGVRVRRCRIDDLDRAGDVDSDDPGAPDRPRLGAGPDDPGPVSSGRVRVRVELGVALLYRTGRVPDLLAALRERIAAAATAHTGWIVDRIDIEVDDVYLPDD